MKFSFPRARKYRVFWWAIRSGSALLAAAAVLAPFLRRLVFMLPTLARLFPQPLHYYLNQFFTRRARSRGHGGGPAAGGGQQSTINTRYFSMSLDHASGQLEGEVLEGPHQGKTLGALAEPDLLRLWQQCQDDPQSAAVLEAYLDQRLGDDWQTRYSQDQGSGHRSDGSGDDIDHDAMTVEQAFLTLGLTPGQHVTADDVRKAHRRLMQRVHPDLGGNDYLASRVNAARDVLLDHLG